MTKLSEHFDSSEFVCRDGSEHAIDPRLILMLEQIRARFGARITITSGYRSPGYNASIGGASRSYHCKGMAADIQVAGVSPADVAAYCDQRFPDAGVGQYPNWVHVDCRGYRARWGFAAKKRRGAREFNFALAAPFGWLADSADDAVKGVLVDSTKWALARALAEIAIRWGLRALRDWRVSPEELLDLADELLQVARRLTREATPDHSESSK